MAPTCWLPLLKAFLLVRSCEACDSVNEGLAEMVAWGRQYLPQLHDYPTDYVLRA